MKTEFELLGYFRSYYVAGKYIGCETYVDKDRKEYGYNGRIKAVVTETITFKNGKKIKAGTEAITELFPLNGRVKDDALIKSIQNNQNKAV
jgi:hypothetical protein